MSFNNDMVNLVLKVFDNSLITGITVSIDGVYKNVTTGAYNPATGALTRTTAEIPVKLVKKNDVGLAKSGDNAISSITDSGSANEGADYLEFLIAPVTGVIPSQGIDDELVISNKTYKVMSVRSRDLGPNRLVYEVKAIG
jgi:hypothetical protein